MYKKNKNKLKKDGTISHQGEGVLPRIWTEERGNLEADELEKWIKNPLNYWLGEFAVERGYYAEVFSDLKKVSSKFRQIYKKAKQIQANRLFRGALTNKYNSALAIFALKNHHGWKDRFEQKVSGNNLNLIFDEKQIRNIAKRIISNQSSEKKSD